MQISLDSGLTWIDAPEGVKISYDIMIWHDEESNAGDGELVVNCTDEGVISDVCSISGVIATESETAQEIVDRLLD